MEVPGISVTHCPLIAFRADGASGDLPFGVEVLAPVLDACSIDVDERTQTKATVQRRGFNPRVIAERGHDVHIAHHVLSVQNTSLDAIGTPDDERNLLRGLERVPLFDSVVAAESFSVIGSKDDQSIFIALAHRLHDAPDVLVDLLDHAVVIVNIVAPLRLTVEAAVAALTWWLLELVVEVRWQDGQFVAEVVNIFLGSGAPAIQIGREVTDIVGVHKARDQHIGRVAVIVRYEGGCAVSHLRVSVDTHPRAPYREHVPARWSSRTAHPRIVPVPTNVPLAAVYAAIVRMFLKPLSNVRNVLSYADVVVNHSGFDRHATGKNAGARRRTDGIAGLRFNKGIALLR